MATGWTPARSQLSARSPLPSSRQPAFDAAATPSLDVAAAGHGGWAPSRLSPSRMMPERPPYHSPPKPPQGKPPAVDGWAPSRSNEERPVPAQGRKGWEPKGASPPKDDGASSSRGWRPGGRSWQAPANPSGSKSARSRQQSGSAMSRASVERMELGRRAYGGGGVHEVAPTGAKITGAPGDGAFGEAEGRAVAPYRRHREFAHKPTQQVAPRGRDGAALRSPVRKGPNAHVEATLGDEGSAGYSSHAQGRKALNTSGHSGEVTALADQLKWPKKTNKYGIALKSHATQGRDFAESTEEVGEGRSGNIKHQRRPAMLGDFQREHTGATGVGIGDNDQRVRAWEALRSDPNFDGAHGQTSQEIAKTYAPPEVTGPAGSTTVGDPMASLAADYRASSRLEQYEAAGRFDGAAGLNTTELLKNRERWQQDAETGVSVDKEVIGAGRPLGRRWREAQILAAAAAFAGPTSRRGAAGGHLDSAPPDPARISPPRGQHPHQRAGPELRASSSPTAACSTATTPTPRAGDRPAWVGERPRRRRRQGPTARAPTRSRGRARRPTTSLVVGARGDANVVFGRGAEGRARWRHFDDGATTVTKETRSRGRGHRPAGATTHTINRTTVTNASRYHHAERRKGDGKGATCRRARRPTRGCTRCSSRASVHGRPRPPPAAAPRAGRRRGGGERRGRGPATPVGCRWRTPRRTRSTSRGRRARDRK